MCQIANLFAFGAHEARGWPFQKLRQWRDLKLLDRRTKTHGEKRVTKTYRLRIEVVAYTEKRVKERGQTVTHFLEEQILK
jgi:hypothetical protein